MKKLTFTIVFTMFIALIIAQPAAFNYQTVVRDAGGNIISGQEVSFRISILEDAVNGTAVYTEYHSATTNSFGLATLEIGKGTPVMGTFNAIDWGTGDHFIEVSLDLTGGSNFVMMGASQLLSVPYALHSRSSENLTGEITVGDLSDVDLTGVADGKVIKHNAAGEKWIVSDDLNTTYTAGVGLTLSGDQFSASFSGNGDATTISRSDHNHFGQSWSGSAANGLAITNSNTSGSAIFSNATSTTGNTNGFYGSSASSNGSGVYGRAVANNSTTSFGIAGHHFWGGAGIGAWSYTGRLFEGRSGDYPGGTLRFYVNNSGHVFAQGYSTLAKSPDKSGNEYSTLYAMQSPEAWFEDFGKANLINGSLVVQIEPDFSNLVNLKDDYYVFLTPMGECSNLYVINQTHSSFEVREANGGQSAVSFHYRIIAKRQGYEKTRLEKVIIEEMPQPTRE